MLTIQDAIAH